MREAAGAGRGAEDGEGVGAWSGRRSWRSAPGSRGRGAGEDRSGPAYRTSGPLARTVGREVYHESFGRGVVVMAEPDGSEVKFTVRFGARTRKVLGRFLTGGVDADQP
jgi:hypothetical protein